MIETSSINKKENNYFYQFSYADSPEHITEIGEYMNCIKKDPFLKICAGVYADAHLLQDAQQLKQKESVFKAVEHYERFVPVLHFTFKFSVDPIKDIALIREKMPYVKYIQLNDIPDDHYKVLQYANKFFLVDMPISDETMQLIDDEKFVKEIIENKSFIFLDNSRGAGKQDSKTNSMKKINKLLEKGINDIAVSGGFGPDTLDLYFDLREQYKINF